MFRVVIVSLIAWSALPWAIAQTTSATCMASYNWASNSLKQSPCLVASYLLGTCGTGSHDVPFLPEGTHYVGPSTATVNPCQCNTVVYSLLSACGECQNRTISDWAAWSSNCPSVDIGSFPGKIPSGTRVPGWAYLDVKANNQFDANLAKANANSTESAAPQPSSSSTTTTTSRSSVRTTAHRPTSTITPSSSTTIVSTSAPTTSAASEDPQSSDDVVRDTRIDKIIGGTIGGVFALALFSGLAAHFYRRRQRRSERAVMLDSPTMEYANALPIQATPTAPTTTVSPYIVVHSDDT